MKFAIKYCFFALLPTAIVIPVNAQNANILGQSISKTPTLPTDEAAPLFLLIPPDGRANGTGEAGVATSPDVYSNYWNPAKLAFARDTMGMGVSYMAWLRQIVPDRNYCYLAGFYKLPKHQTLGCSLRYFELGKIQVNGMSGPATFNPNEYAIDASYARQLSDSWSAALTGRFICSNLVGTSNFVVLGIPTHIVNSFAADISAYYQSHPLTLLTIPFSVAAGVCISNIGPKISYSNTMASYFSPTNLRLGGALNLAFDKLNKINLLFDANKLLVPTPPFIGSSVMIGLDEITLSQGIEYWYNNMFAFRGGFFYENKTKGGRQFFTMGAGFTLNVITVDAAYLIPVTQQSPLQNTIIISLAFHFNKTTKQKKAGA